MTRPGWWLLSFLALASEPHERDAVLGDVAESGKSAYAVIPDILGLIVRRQAGLWMVWRPWVALIGVSALAGIPLSQVSFRFNVDLAEQLMAYQKYGVHYGTGVTAGKDVAFLFCLAVGLLVGRGPADSPWGRFRAVPYGSRGWCFISSCWIRHG